MALISITLSSQHALKLSVVMRATGLTGPCSHRDRQGRGFQGVTRSELQSETIDGLTFMGTMLQWVVSHLTQADWASGSSTTGKLAF